MLGRLSGDVFTAAARTTPLRLILLACVLGVAGNAAAQEPTDDQKAAIKANCRSDYMANCFSVPRGGVEAFQCLKKNSREPFAWLPAGGECDKATGPASCCRKGRTTTTTDRRASGFSSSAANRASTSSHGAGSHNGSSRDAGSSGSYRQRRTDATRGPGQTRRNHRAGTSPSGQERGNAAASSTTSYPSLRAARARCPPGADPDAGAQRLPGRVPRLLLRRRYRRRTRRPVS